jgi:hypothetical protein
MNPLIHELRRRAAQLSETAHALAELLREAGPGLDLSPGKAARLLLRMDRLLAGLERVRDAVGAAYDPQELDERAELALFVQEPGHEPEPAAV